MAKGGIKNNSLKVHLRSQFLGNVRRRDRRHGGTRFFSEDLLTAELEADGTRIIHPRDFGRTKCICGLLPMLALSLES